jgi:hypothetical protein
MVLYIVLAAGVAFSLLTVAFFYFRKSRASAKCSSCGAPSRFGYSSHAESPSNEIVPLCLACMSTKLRDDYQKYSGRALVIEPIAGLPTYVFQPKSTWADSKLLDDLSRLASNREASCEECGSNSRFLWITANGLLPSNFSQVLSNGLSQTLLRWGNAEPRSLCGACCVASIVKTIEARDLSFLEVCSPRSEDGFVIPMAY